MVKFQSIFRANYAKKKISLLRMNLLVCRNMADMSVICVRIIFYVPGVFCRPNIYSNAKPPPTHTYM